MSEYESMDTRDHIREKSMWSSGTSPIDIKDLYGLKIIDNDYQIVEIKNKHTPTILKMFDEILVNASDEEYRNRTAKKADRVTSINIEFYDGIMTISNNGKGIPIEMLKDKDYYLPQMLFHDPLSGSNMKTDSTKVSGGVNGCGAKIVNLHSTKFNIEIINKKVKYTQEFLDCGRIVGSPTITKCNAENIVKVTFIPDYLSLGYNSPANPVLLQDLHNWLLLRIFQLSLYCSNDVNITFNGLSVPNLKDIDEFMVILYPSILQLNRNTFIVDVTEDTTFKRYDIRNIEPIGLIEAGSVLMRMYTFKFEKELPNMQCAIIVLNAKLSQNSIKNLSVVNGISVTKGNHFNFIKKLIEDSCKKKIGNLVRIYMKLSINNIQWNSQSKDQLIVDTSRFANIKSKISSKLIKDIMATYELLSQVTKTNKSKLIKVDKYTPAEKIRTEPEKCYLFECEGDSAAVFIKSILYAKNSPVNSKYYGWLSLGGVIINALKNVSYNKYDARVLKSKLNENKTLKNFLVTQNLDLNKKYDTPIDLATLNYKGIIIATDADVDGAKIAGLVITMYWTLWPELVKNGYIKKLNTPIIKLFYDKAEKKSTGISFKYELDYEIWRDNNPDLDVKLHAKYYKGLATYSKADIDELLSNPEELITIPNKLISNMEYCDITPKMINDLFGVDSTPRKEILSRELKEYSEEFVENIESTHLTPIEYFMNHDVVIYKFDAISRQIPCIIDGLKPCTRKILFGAMKHPEQMKVYQLGGHVASDMFYMHGNMSLDATISGMAKYYPGSRNYPLLIGHGTFGDRHTNYDPAPRYVGVSLATKFVESLFPPEDNYILDYVYEEGQRAEPKYTVPVIPYGLLDTNKSPSEGWKHSTHAISLESMVSVMYKAFDNTEISNTLLMYSNALYTAIDNDDFDTRNKLYTEISNLMTNEINLVYDTHKFKGTLSYDTKGNWYSNGVFEVLTKGNKVIIHITELPMWVYTDTYLSQFDTDKKSEFLDTFDGGKLYRSVESGNDIDIMLQTTKAKYVKIIDTFGTIEKFISITEKMETQLNYFGKDKLISFDNYASGFMYWFEFRKRLYQKRIEKNIVLYNLKKIYHENMLRFIKTFKGSKLDKDEEEMIVYLESNGFIKFNMKYINENTYSDNENLKYYALDTSENGTKANYNYLMNLPTKDYTEANCNKIQSKIQSIIESIDKYKILLTEKPFAGVSLWKDEVNKCLDIIKLGLKTNWFIS